MKSTSKGVEFAFLLKGENMTTTNEWHLSNQSEEYLDYEKELISFQDEGNSSVDMRLTFDIENRSAYVVTMRRNDDGNTVELGDPINVTWEEGCRMIGDLAKTMPLPVVKACDAFTVRKDLAGKIIFRAVLASAKERVGYERLYQDLSEAGMTNKVLVGEERRLVLDYAESLGFSVNRVYPNPIVAGQVYLNDKVRRKYL